MNDILLLKGDFKHLKKKDSGFGPPKLTGDKEYPFSHIEELIIQLKDVKNFWQGKDFIQDILIDVHYNDVIAKSNRMSYIFHPVKDENIVGARFSSDNDPKHIITYRFTRNELEKAIHRLTTCKEVIKKKFGKTKINQKILDIINLQKKFSSDIPNTPLLHCLVECYYIEKFGKERLAKKIKEDALVSIYDTGEDTIELLKKFNIHVNEDRLFGKTTLRLYPDEIERLNKFGACLISMAVKDFAEFSKDKIIQTKKTNHTIPQSTNEPIIGVIDTLFDTNAYFSNWVEFKNMLPKDISIQKQDFDHGTAVSSIIVDGPALNPNFDDECGRFRVRHFGVLLNNGGSTFSIIKNIEQIVQENNDIKVWNLSIGSNEEIPKNYISLEASLLDKIQSENDVIFIVAGTNRKFEDKPNKKIGAPADSINSIVVNSVKSNGNPASYTRIGPVLSFYNKPDLCYYGGDENEKFLAIDSSGDACVCGTSFAAPWITRKVAYLIYIMGLSRTAAKALLIDAAAGWMKKENPSTQIGYGLVPIKISDIIQSQNNEIRFILTDNCLKYETCNLRIPIPVVKEQHPFVARATLCYFPHCERNQGVDYTSTEVDMHFGRVNPEKKGDGIEPINGNPQDQVSLNEISKDLKEKNVRVHFRKWDNVKYVAQNVNGRKRKAYENGLWGISLKVKNRASFNDESEINQTDFYNEQDSNFSIKGPVIPFAVVVTLKEIEGKNRIDEFIRRCGFHHWMVYPLKVKNRIDIFNKSEEEIIFD